MFKLDGLIFKCSQEQCEGDKMELEQQPITIQEYRERLQKKTCSIREFADLLGVSYAKGLQLSRIEGFPMLVLGRDKRVILSKVDEFLERYIGVCL